MKQVLAVICIALVSVGAAVASTGKAGKKVVWTESKAERSVLDGATVRLATEDRVALEAELRPAIALYKALALESTLTGHVQDADAYYQEAYRYSRALADVQRGLPIDSVDCMGSGVAAGLTRFGTFRCNVTSGSLEIPAFEHLRRWRAFRRRAVADDRPDRGGARREGHRHDDLRVPGGLATGRREPAVPGGLSGRRATT